MSSSWIILLCLLGSVFGQTVSVETRLSNVQLKFQILCESFSNFIQELVGLVVSAFEAISNSICQFAYSCIDLFNSHSQFVAVFFVLICCLVILIVIVYGEISYSRSELSSEDPKIDFFSSLHQFPSMTSLSTVLDAPPSPPKSFYINHTVEDETLEGCRTPQPMPDRLLPQSTGPIIPKIPNFNINAEVLSKCSTFFHAYDNNGFLADFESQKSKSVSSEQIAKLRDPKKLFISYKDFFNY